MRELGSGILTNVKENSQESEDPDVIVAKPMHTKRVTVRCGICNSVIIVTIVFENVVGKPISVNIKRY